MAEISKVSPHLVTEVVNFSAFVSDMENISYQVLSNDENFGAIVGTQITTSSLDFQVNDKIEKILENQDIIIKNQQDIIYNLKHSERKTQLKILLQLAKLEVILYNMTSSSINSTCYSCKNANADALLTNKDDIFFDPK